MRKYILRSLFVLLVALIGYIAAVLIQGTLTDWQPQERTDMRPVSPVPPAAIADSVIRITSWNIGFAGLGEDADFFYDQGKFLFARGGKIRSERSSVDRNLTGIIQGIGHIQSDIYLLQEVDQPSRRSYYLPVFDSLRSAVPAMAAFYAPNYQVKRVPLPLLEPWRAYGEVNSGLATLSRWLPEESYRYQLPGSFGWPTRIFQLDRCLAIHRFPLRNGKMLMVVNAHFSAYDSDGKLKAAEMAALKTLITKWYADGHYVIVGGDWNQAPPFFTPLMAAPKGRENNIPTNIDPDFMPADWRWMYDPTQPTNRKLYEVYRAGETYTALIDFFLVSPNLKVRKVRTIDLGFRFSDHQPVWMEVEIPTGS